MELHGYWMQKLKKVLVALAAPSISSLYIRCGRCTAFPWISLCIPRHSLRRSMSLQAHISSSWTSHRFSTHSQPPRVASVCSSVGRTTHLSDEHHCLLDAWFQSYPDQATWLPWPDLPSSPALAWSPCNRSSSRSTTSGQNRKWSQYSVTLKTEGTSLCSRNQHRLGRWSSGSLGSVQVHLCSDSQQTMYEVFLQTCVERNRGQIPWGAPSTSSTRFRSSRQTQGWIAMLEWCLEASLPSHWKVIFQPGWASGCHSCPWSFGTRIPAKVDENSFKTLTWSTSAGTYTVPGYSVS